MVSQLVLVRHGQSVYNEQNKFTGWADVELTTAGLQEAVKASSTPCRSYIGGPHALVTHQTAHCWVAGRQALES